MVYHWFGIILLWYDALWIHSRRLHRGKERFTSFKWSDLARLSKVYLSLHLGGWWARNRRNFRLLWRLHNCWLANYGLRRQLNSEVSSDVLWSASPMYTTWCSGPPYALEVWCCPGGFFWDHWWWWSIIRKHVCVTERVAYLYCYNVKLRDFLSWCHSLDFRIVLCSLTRSPGKKTPWRLAHDIISVCHNVAIKTCFLRFITFERLGPSRSKTLLIQYYSMVVALFKSLNDLFCRSRHLCAALSSCIVYRTKRVVVVWLI